MSEFKVSFKIDRSDYNPDNITEKELIRVDLQAILDNKQISKISIYAPSRNSIKAIFHNEQELNKVFTHIVDFESKGFHPRLSLALKASRTIFCSGFDPVLLHTYDKTYIEPYLESKGWTVKDVYIFNSNATFKIEFETKEMASNFLHTNTEIGGIQILQQHKETEVDRTIQQCWECGLINTDHTSQNCQGVYKDIMVKNCGIQP